MCLLLLALGGISLQGAGPVFFQNRERYADNGIKIEWTQEKKERQESDEANT